MNLAHLHLVLNHIPMIGIPVALAFMAHGIFQKNGATQRFALMILLVLAICILPIYFTGEPAEKVVEHLPGVTESFIEAHEDAAMVSMFLTLITGASALLGLWFQKDPKKSRLINFSVMGLAGISVISLLYTANLGGKVRHTELRSDSTVQTVNDKAETSDNDKDDD